MLASGSTHIDPMGAQLPSATAFLIRSQTCGWCSGWSAASAVALAKVREALRTVSRSGHSQDVVQIEGVEHVL